MPILFTPFGVEPPPPSYDDWWGVDMTWTDANGVVWRLLDPSSPVHLVAVKGLHLPVWTRYTAESAAVAGSRHRGTRTQTREPWWLVAVHSTAGTDDWLSVDRAWWDGLGPDSTGEWAVTVKGETRKLTLRLTEAADEMPRDPLIRGDQEYALTFAADQPYWQGPAIVRAFTTEAEAPFFEPSGLFHISRSLTLASAEVENPGDVEAWPVWTVTGPCTGFSVGVDGRTVNATTTLSAGDHIVIDSRPDRQTVVDSDGVDRLDDITAAEWAPIPAGASVDLDLTAAGTGAGFSIRAELAPLYRRAW